MHIDKYKKGESYINNDDVGFDTPEDFILGNYFGFCSCGQPDECLKYIRDVLLSIDKASDHDNDRYTQTKEERESVRTTPFNSPGEAMTMWYLMDKLDLTEHGSNVMFSWLDEKGYELLEDLLELYPLDN